MGLVRELWNDANTRLGSDESPQLIVEIDPKALPRGIPCGFSGQLDVNRVFLVIISEHRL